MGMHTHMHMHESPSKIPAAYPRANFMIRIPELDGKTVKMFLGGYICLETHFIPVWQKLNSMRGSVDGGLGIAHALSLGLAPWLAVEVPSLVEKGVLKHEDRSS